jgi:hypothetical protein
MMNYASLIKDMWIEYFITDLLELLIYAFTIQRTESGCHCIVVSIQFCTLKSLGSLPDMEIPILNEDLCYYVNYIILL